MDIKAIYKFEHIPAKNEMHVEITQSWRYRRYTSSSIYQQRTNASRDNSIIEINARYKFEHIPAKNECK